MNNLNNSLKLTFNGEYKVNKPEDQSGEYIDASIGADLVEGLQALFAACEIERKLNGGKVNLNETAWANLLQDLKERSSRALGQVACAQAEGADGAGHCDYFFHNFDVEDFGECTECKGKDVRKSSEGQP